MVRFKVAWVFSGEDWGIQRLSKHYYALELCNYAEEVYFFNPFSSSFKSKIKVEKVSDNKKLKIVSYSYFRKGKRFIPEIIRLFMLEWHLKYLMKRTNTKPDIVFSFNHVDILSFRPFHSKYNIFLMYDWELQDKTLPRIGFTADIMVTITSNIRDKLTKYNKPVLLLQHGLNEDFKNHALENLKKINEYQVKHFPVNILFIGSLFKGTLDRRSFRVIIEKYPSITFHFFGAYQIEENNLGGMTINESRSFIDFLKHSTNVVLYGPQFSSKIIEKLNIIDCCIHIEDYKKSKRDCSNAHKLIEYLATGKPIFSTMVDESVFHENLLFISKTDTIENFDHFIQQFYFESTYKKYLARITYALEHTYFNNTKYIIDNLNKA